jgi:hypothetical protein
VHDVGGDHCARNDDARMNDSNIDGFNGSTEHQRSSCTNDDNLTWRDFGGHIPGKTGRWMESWVPGNTGHDGLPASPPWSSANDTYRLTLRQDCDSAGEVMDDDDMACLADVTEE